MATDLKVFFLFLYFKTNFGGGIKYSTWLLFENFECFEYLMQTPVRPQWKALLVYVCGGLVCGWVGGAELRGSKGFMCLIRNVQAWRGVAWRGVRV